MGHRTVRAIVGCWIAAAGLLAGCAAVTHRDDHAPSSPEQLRIRRELSHAAQAAMDRGDWSEAQQTLQRLAVIEPRSAEVHQRLGRVWQAQSRFDLAEAAYHRALEYDPEYPAALIGLGQVEIQRGRLNVALGHLDTAVELDPSRADAHLARAEACEALGRTEDALAACFRALQFDPTSASTMRRVAALQLAHNRPEQALARLDQVVELTPEDPEARLLRGRARLVLGEAEPAIADLRVAASKLPDRPDVFYELAHALEATRPARLEDALQAAERAAILAPNWVEAHELTRRLRR